MPQEDPFASDPYDPTRLSEMLKQGKLVALPEANGHTKEYIVRTKPENSDKMEYAFMGLVRREIESAESLLYECLKQNGVNTEVPAERLVCRDDDGLWDDNWDETTKFLITAKFYLSRFYESLKVGGAYQMVWHGLSFMSYMIAATQSYQKPLLELGVKVKQGGKKGSNRQLQGKWKSRDIHLWKDVTTELEKNDGRSLNDICKSIAEDWTKEGEPLSKATVYRAFTYWKKVVEKALSERLYEHSDEWKDVLETLGVNF